MSGLWCDGQRMDSKSREGALRGKAVAKRFNQVQKRIF